MTVEERIRLSETRVFKTVFPDILNHHHTMFGGQVLLMMTETAFMTATRFARKSFVIAKADNIQFKKPIPAASLVELIGSVQSTGNTSLQVEVRVFVESMSEDGRQQAVGGLFTLVAIGKDHRPVSLGIN
ncbi:acyl-CoA thioesterase [Niabella terrae]